MASVGLWMTGSGRSPTVTEWGPLKIAARMMDPFVWHAACRSGRTSVRYPVLIVGDLVAPVDEVRDRLGRSSHYGYWQGLLEARAWPYAGDHVQPD